MTTSVNPLQALDSTLNSTTVHEGIRLPPVFDILKQVPDDLPAFMERMGEAQRLAGLLAKMAYHLGLVRLVQECEVVESVLIAYKSSHGIALGNLKKGVQLMFTEGSVEAPVHRRNAQKAFDRLRTALPFSSVDGSAVSNLFIGLPRGQGFLITRETAEIYLEHVMGPEVYARYRVDVEKNGLHQVFTDDPGLDPTTNPTTGQRPRL